MIFLLYLLFGALIILFSELIKKEIDLKLDNFQRIILLLLWPYILILCIKYLTYKTYEIL